MKNKITLIIKNTQIILVYIDNMLEYVLDENDKKMMQEVIQEGVGYKIHDHHGVFIKAKVCDARYVRIMDLNCYVPKYLFISNEK